MSLSNFFRINMPYGIEKSKEGKWIAFNREYKPLGWNTGDHVNYEDHPIATNYKNLTESKLTQIGGEQNNIFKDENGDITRIMLYNDSSYPSSSSANWDKYINKIKLLSKIEISNK